MENCESAEPAVGFTILDGVALVLGAAIGSLHLRDSGGEDFSRSGLLLIWMAFAGVAVTAAGPFVYLVRRFGMRVPGFPSDWERLWVVLGTPWIVTATLRLGNGGGRLGVSPFYVPALFLGIGIACLLTLSVLSRTWIMRPSGLDDEDARPWSARVAMLVAVCWPVQCGLGLVVASP